MEKNNLKMVFAAILFLFAINACKKDSPEPSTGVLKGNVTDVATGDALADVRIIVYDATTNSPTEHTVLTQSDGTYSVELNPGVYYLNLNKQSYLGIPAPGVSPVSVEVIKGQETVSDYMMSPSGVTNGGSITGKVVSGETPIAGALVVAVLNDQAFSSVTDAEGIYYIYNVLAATYEVKAYLAGYNSEAQPATVSDNTETLDINLTLTGDATGEVSGQVTFLAMENGVVDVSLTHQVTKETIPGLVTTTNGSGTYTISNVPNGTYIARASYNNDTYVVDPDWIIKNGEPIVTIASNMVDRDFSVTGAVALVSPTNESSTTSPVEVTDTPPTFTWQAYSSSSDYVIEVSDINGTVIWGGFTEDAGNITKNIVIPSSSTSVEFNSDGKASAQLQTNIVYRWRIFASKNDVQSATGWRLISASEEQMGIFIIK